MRPGVAGATLLTVISTAGSSGNRDLLKIMSGRIIGRTTAPGPQWRHRGAAMRTPRRATMAEVAKRAGCSQSTVSLVLNEIPSVRIAEETRRRVREAARAIGYQVPWPRLGGGGEMGVIGFVVDRLATSPEAVVSVDGAREAAWAEGRMLLIVSTLSDPEVERRSIESLLARPV